MGVIGLDYPGLVATTARFSEYVPGDYVAFEGTRYVICDPIYVNATVGLEMPNFGSASQKTIEIRELPLVPHIRHLGDQK